MTTPPKFIVLEENNRPDDCVSERRVLILSEKNVSFSYQSRYPDGSSKNWQYDPESGASLSIQDVKKIIPILTEWLASKVPPPNPHPHHKNRHASDPEPTSPTLLPCPGCNGKASIYQLHENSPPDDDPHEVSCDDCQFYAWGDTRLAAIQTWNKRASQHETPTPCPRCHSLDIIVKGKDEYKCSDCDFPWALVPGL